MGFRASGFRSLGVGRLRAARLQGLRVQGFMSTQVAGSRLTPQNPLEELA